MRTTALAIGLFFTSACAASAQTASAFRDEFLLQFDASMEKFIALAEVTPADKFAWGPSPEVMQVGHVFMHVARYNYGYTSENMKARLPAGVTLNTMESERRKEAVLAALRGSDAFVKSFARGLTEEQLTQKTRLYGRDVPQWAVLFQLLAHMNEHLGQSISYTRAQGIVPPWSR
jgi:uncharacterized damage-inducible protein DinB